MTTNWQKEQRKLRNIITFNELCKFAGVSSLDKFHEEFDGFSTFQFNYDEAKKQGASDKDADEAALEEESKEESERSNKYVSTVEKVSTKLFKEHGLSLTEVKKDSLTYRFEPDVSWKDSLGHLLETINGVGHFTFSSIKELCDSGPYTIRQAVIQHIRYVFMHPEVYEGTKAKYLIERAMERS